MPKLLRYSLIALCFVGLVAVRAFEDVLFYDPFIAFFKHNYHYLDAPKTETFKFVANTALRFLINTVLSLVIIYFIFKDEGILKFASILYGIAFVILISPFLYLIQNPQPEQYFYLFYVRRFLIQPILLILLLPAFYYFRLNKNEDL